MAKADISPKRQRKDFPEGVTFRRDFNEAEQALIRKGRYSEAKEAWTKRNRG